MLGYYFRSASRKSLLRRHVEKGSFISELIMKCAISYKIGRKTGSRSLYSVRSCFKSLGCHVASIAAAYKIELTPSERAELDALPLLRRAPVGSVLAALEAKACMTAHQRAPRLYDELNSSHLTVHGANDHAIAAGFAMVNIASRYLSPDRNRQKTAKRPVWSTHDQPRDARLAIDKVRQLPRRSRAGDTGYDALSIVVVECANDGSPRDPRGNAPCSTSRRHLSLCVNDRSPVAHLRHAIPGPLKVWHESSRRRRFRIPR